MRGKAAHYTGGSIECRITPAYAGKSVGTCFEAGKHEDHPRLCGEKVQLGIQGLKRVGSPPPMRGKGFFRENFPARSRITPAYAGKRT